MDSKRIGGLPAGGISVDPEAEDDKKSDACQNARHSNAVKRSAGGLYGGCVDCSGPDGGQHYTRCEDGKAVSAERLQRLARNPANKARNKANAVRGGSDKISKRKKMDETRESEVLSCTTSRWAKVASPRPGAIRKASVLTTAAARTNEALNARSPTDGRGTPWRKAAVQEMPIVKRSCQANGLKASRLA